MGIRKPVGPGDTIRCLKCRKVYNIYHFFTKFGYEVSVNPKDEADLEGIEKTMQSQILYFFPCGCNGNKVIMCDTSGSGALVMEDFVDA